MSLFSAQMYMSVCVIGACTCVVQLPVLISLSNRRQPGLLSNQAVCTAWIILFHFLQRTASFFVAFVSVSRAIGLGCPAHMFTNHRVFGGMVVYTGFSLCVDVSSIGAKWTIPGFSEVDGFCILQADGNSSDVGNQVFKIIRSIEMYVIWLISSISMVVSIQKVMALTAVKKLRKFSRDASVTAITLVGTHVVLQLPLLVDRTLDLTSHYPSDNKFSKWQFKLFSRVVCTVVNAPLNAILLYVRTPRFRAWNRSSRIDMKITEYSVQMESGELLPGDRE